MSIFRELFIYILMCLIQTVPCFGHVEKANLPKLWHRSRRKEEQTGRTGMPNTRGKNNGRMTKNI